MKRILELVLNALFPKKKSLIALETFVKNESLRTLDTSPSTPHTFIHALFHYKHPSVRTLVWEIKYTSNQLIIDGVAELLAEEIGSYLEEKSGFTSRQWILIPIPSSKNHFRDKGFNQTEELTKAIMKTFIGSSLSCSFHALIKTRETEPQATIKNRSKRLENLKGCYKVIQKELVAGKNVILIDDVTTTGSTFIEARRALKEAGAKEVIAFAVAH